MILLLTGAITWSNEQKLELINMGHEIIYVQDERIPLKEQGVNLLKIEGVICNGLFLYNDISEFKKLRYIQLTSAGYDRVPMDYVREHEIQIFNARGVYSIPMAEFAISGVLQLYKQTKFFQKNQEAHVWEKKRDILELYGKQVCIVGCGSVGTECAKRFQVFGCKIIGIDILPRNDKNYDEMMELNQLDEVLSSSDIVILTLPLTEETRNLINQEKLKKMKQGAVLVNIARGAILDMAALIDVLPSLRGVVLDVFEEEPLDKIHPLWDMENVIITPHNSFVGEGNRKRLMHLILNNLHF